MTDPSGRPANTAGDAGEPHGAGIPDPTGETVGARGRQARTLDCCVAELAMDPDLAAGSTKRRPPPSWSSPRQACALIIRGYTFRTGVVVAGVVGTTLSAVNEGTVIASGHIHTVTWVRVAINYLVPFLVASVGYLSPFRQRRRTRP